MIHDVATENMGALCVTEPYRSLRVPLFTSHYEGAQQKADMAAMLLQDLGVSHHNGTQAPYVTSFLPSSASLLKCWPSPHSTSTAGAPRSEEAPTDRTCASGPILS